MYNLAGQCINKFQPCVSSLGVKTVNWSPSGQVLAVGYYDHKIRLLNYITFKCISELEHPTKISSKDLVIFKENDGSSAKRNLNSQLLNESSANGGSGLTESELVSIYSCPSKCISLSFI